MMAARLHFSSGDYIILPPRPDVHLFTVFIISTCFLSGSVVMYAWVLNCSPFITSVVESISLRLFLSAGW